MSQKRQTERQSKGGREGGREAGRGREITRVGGFSKRDSQLTQTSTNIKGMMMGVSTSSSALRYTMRALTTW